MPGNKVQRFRESLMMSKAELARKAGVSTLTIDRVEGGRPCRLDTKKKILLALGFKIGEQGVLFGGVEYQQPQSVAGGAVDAIAERRENPWD